MKRNRVMWGLVSLVVLTTLTISFGRLDSRSKEKYKNQPHPTSTPDKGGFEDLSKYAIAEYNAPEPENAQERDKRRLVSQRYDKQDWVRINLHPDTGGVGRYDEDEKPPPEIIPNAESDLIFIGRIVDVKAYLSNDKEGVYSEFTIRAEQILKNDASKKVEQGGTITTDRAGGFVSYPNGQKVLYRHNELGLPFVGNEYLMFLTNDKKSPNYSILTLYELKDGAVIQLDSKRRFDDFKNISRLRFLDVVKNKIVESAHLKKNQP